MILIQLIIFFVIIITIKYSNTKFELLSFKTKLIFAGDSIFANEKYVKKGHSFKYNITNLYSQSKVVAKDNTKISSLWDQLNNIQPLILDKNNKLIISIGGNDILNYNRFYNGDIKTIEIKDIFIKYENMIKFIQQRVKCNIILCNIYFLPSVKYKKYNKIIKIWNDWLEIFSKKKKIKLIKLDKILYDPTHFNNHIEPSEIGSKILAKKIYDKVLL